MGVYAETSGATIECKTKAVALAVEKIMKKKYKGVDKNGNKFATEIEIDKNYIYFIASSGRIQNLEWQMEQVWNDVKDIKGVISLSAPFLVEGQGAYFSNEEE